MTEIILNTFIEAPIERVFDLSRDIDFHKKSASQTGEIAVGGVTTGLINMGESVRWKGKHFGMWLTHESLITEFKHPRFFTDEMVKGNFKSFKHKHLFTEKNNITTMTDILRYETPYGFLGKLFDYLFLHRHLTEFLEVRNTSLKLALENESSK